MNYNTLKWTPLQKQIFAKLCQYSGKSIYQKELAKELGTSASAIAKMIEPLVNQNIVLVSKNITKTFELNRDNKNIITLKRISNLEQLYASQLIEYLEEKYPFSLIVLFGSYSFGEDTHSSDIDILIISDNTKEYNLSEFEQKLARTIHISLFSDKTEIPFELHTNLFNGIVLSGRYI